MSKKNIVEKINFGGSFNSTKITKNAMDKVKANKDIDSQVDKYVEKRKVPINKDLTIDKSKTITKTPMSTSGAQITTNQRQSKELAAKNKDVKLNKFNRTQTYGADAKGVKLVPGAKIGQKVDRSTVQTKAAFDFKGIKKGERLGVLTRNQRRKYDLMAAQRNKKIEVKTEPPKQPTTPTTTTTTTTPAPVENKGKLKKGQGGLPLGTTTQRQGGTVKSGVTLFKKGEDAKKFTNKTGFASKVDTVKGKDPRPMGRDAAKRRKVNTQKNNSKFENNPNVKEFRKDVEELKTTAKFGSNATIKTLDGKEYKPGDPGYEAELKKARSMVQKSMKKEEFTPYDIVLEYLLSTEQVATIEEANYVMTEMDAKTIQSIVSD